MTRTSEHLKKKFTTGYTKFVRLSKGAKPSLLSQTFEAIQMLLWPLMMFIQRGPNLNSPVTVVKSPKPSVLLGIEPPSQDSGKLHMMS